MKRPYDGTYTHTVEVTAADIPTMETMSIEAYNNYLPELLWVDHHDVLRATQGEYPVAVTPPQLDALIAFLESLRPRFAEGDYRADQATPDSSE